MSALLIMGLLTIMFIFFGTLLLFRALSMMLCMLTIVLIIVGLVLFTITHLCS